MQYEYLIVGAGPSGLQLGYYLEKSDRTYLIVEEGSGSGSFFKRFAGRPLWRMGQRERKRSTLAHLFFS
jgi:flavin-dependent dehydrogenase